MNQLKNSNRFKFTTKAIESLPANSADAKSTEKEYSDIEITGLKLLVGKSGTKKFLLRYVHTGKKQAMSIGQYPAISLSEARQKALELKNKVAQGINPKDEREAYLNRMTFKDFANEHYLPHAKVNKRSSTSDRSKLVIYLIPKWGNIALEDIGNRQIQDYLNSLSQKLKPATINRHHSLIHRMFVLALQWGYIDKNPASHISKRQENNRMERFLSEPEIRKLFQAADEDDNLYAGALVKFLLLTASRRAEATNAKYKDIKLQGKRLVWRIPHTKSGKERVVPLAKMALDLITRLPRQPGNEYIFCGSIEGQPITNPIKAFKRMLKRAGIESSVRLHDLRHTAASLIVNHGGTLYDVQAALGHSSSKMSERYSHLSDHRLIQTSNKVSQCVQNALLN